MAKYNEEEYKQVKKFRRRKTFWLFINKYTRNLYWYTDRHYMKNRHELMSIGRERMGKPPFED